VTGDSWRFGELGGGEGEVSGGMWEGPGQQHQRNDDGVFLGRIYLGLGDFGMDLDFLFSYYVPTVLLLLLL